MYIDRSGPPHPSPAMQMELRKDDLEKMYTRSSMELVVPSNYIFFFH